MVHAWKETSVPTLPGVGLPPRIFDTATQTLVEASRSSLYVCGITPYDATHLGHAATYVAYDTLLRAWQDAGQSVTYVQNVTDIDDPLLERAEATGVTWQELAESQTNLFRSDMEALSVIPPTYYKGVVETMESIMVGVQQMLNDGSAYWVGKDVYADLAIDKKFGSLGNLDHSTQMKFFTERGGDPDTPGKRDALDPLLWRGERPGEPTWDGGELGMGRPGWHIECAVIASEYLDVPFMVQGGGEDLVFPHHEMSISHLRRLTKVEQPAAINMHAALISYQGEKMSKSLGNLIFVSKLRDEGVPADAIRLVLLGQHYRDEWEYSPHLLEQASERLARWQDAMTAPERTVGPTGAQILDRVRLALSEDLNTPEALKIVDQWVHEGRTTTQDRELIAKTADALLGIKTLGTVVTPS